MMSCAIVTSHIDYCNLLLHGASAKNLKKLQGIQNRAARIVCNVGRSQAESSRDLLIDLHWLPVRQRIDYKIATLCFKAYRLHQPPYLSVHTQQGWGPRGLSSSLRTTRGQFLVALALALTSKHFVLVDGFDGLMGLVK